ncbi:MAG: methenyltetrahydromethanopterin cyclohydrolase [Thiothrix sp.]|nr:methenyltetrahydromethanopterin cyclohydrolase [Thiothrix sp.]HPQ96633.1 methenyltetrahydromethanopterin cyclohydrolase [Thiolinea sp.]
MSTAAQNPGEAGLSINALSQPLVAALIRDAAQLCLGVSRMDNGCTVIDAGIQARGSLAAGRRIAAICMAGLGDIQLTASPAFTDWPWQVSVATSQPVLACLGSQYAGWNLGIDDPARPGKKFHALGSGPARALAQREPLFQTLGYQDNAAATCLILEADRLPPSGLAEKVAADCGLAPAQLTLILTPTGSLAGVVQIAARVVEVALHKAHELDFPLQHIVDALGTTPLPPPVRDGLAAMGRTNDTILFGGQVHLFVSSSDAEAEQLAQQLPCSTSRDYGKPFAQVFADYQYDFFQVDPLLFSPSRVAVTVLDSGRTFLGGQLDSALLYRSFGLVAG